MSKSTSGNLIIVSAPSGGGKTSLVNALLQTVDNIAVSISHTTRNKRPGEEEGVDYFFTTHQEFKKKINNNDFIEYAKVFNHYYGTSVEQVKSRLSRGIDVLLDIDWQGAQQIKRLFDKVISIFVIPPSMKVLKQRLLHRGQDDKAVIAYRMQRAQDELSHFSEFDYLIVNDDFHSASLEMQAIVIANRLRLLSQQERQKELLSLLLGSQ